ncbi:MAG: type II toxin-antitoxin system HicB family antitoxin [Acidobacteriota bacterium]
MEYPVHLRKDGKFILVTFPDIPEAITQGDNRIHALEMAREALETAMDFYFEDRRRVPMPSKPKKGQAVVELSPSVAAKVLLLNEMLRQKVRPAELARRIGTTPQEVNRLTNLRHASKIDRVDAALRALGKRLIVRAA